MMRIAPPAFLLVVVLAAAEPATATAQQTARDAVRVTTWELVLTDGSRVFGTVERQTATDIVFRTTTGAVITVRPSEVAALREVSGTVVRGEFLRDDPNPTRLFFGPTGRALRKGKAYLGVYEFLLPFIQVGVTDRFSIGGGSPLLFFADDWHRPYWLTPKLQVFDDGMTSVSAGAFLGFGGHESAGIAYGVLTRERPPGGSFTVGAGMAYSSNGGRAPVVMAGADGRLSRNIRAITETYLWEGGHGVASAGVRFLGERLSADLAIAVPIGTSGVFAFPVVNFVYMF
jgi:hypothetical protein